MNYFIRELSVEEQMTLAEISVNGPLKKVLNLELKDIKEQLCNLTIGDDLVKFACTYFALQEKRLYVEEFLQMIDNLFNEHFQHQTAEEDS